MELETPPKEVLRAAPPGLAAERKLSSSFACFAWTIGIFLALWAGFYLLDRELPYLTNGSDVIYRAKLRFERQGQIFPANPRVLRVMIFGDSKTLAGFMPSVFDPMAAAQGMNVSSFNSGFPGTRIFLPELETVAKRGQAPDVLLLTLPWGQDAPKPDLFHWNLNDHATITEFFPFRLWLRDSTDFLLTARDHGGLGNLYRESKAYGKQVIEDRGYYLITEQSRFPSGRLPDNFHLASDQPDVVATRDAPDHGEELDELNRLIRQHHMQCYFVPSYRRIGEFATPPEKDLQFAALLERATPCQLLGPDYFLYPNRLFSDQTHMNTDGARIYTAALFRLLQDRLSQGLQRAVQ